MPWSTLTSPGAPCSILAPLAAQSSGRSGLFRSMTVRSTALSSTKAKRTSLRVRFASDSPLEGDGFEPSVPPREKPTSSPVETRSPEPPRGGDGLSAPTGQRQCGQQRQQWRRAGTAPFADQPFGGCECPSGRVSRWPQPALFAQYSQVRQ